MKLCLLLVAVSGSVLFGAQLNVRVSWRNGKPASVTASAGARIDHTSTLADGLSLDVSWDPSLVKRRDRLQIIWADLISASDPDTAHRLTADPAFFENPPKLTIHANAEESRGFSVALEQLLAEKAMWVPSLGIYLTAGEHPVSFEEHQKELKRWHGRRILDELRSGPEATYQQYAGLWENMGSPSYIHPAQQGPGHIVGLSWDSAIPKFGIDRGSGVWSDYGNPDKFQLWFGFGDIHTDLARFWKGQKLDDGLPVITTAIEKEQVRYNVEQFAFPLDGPPAQRRGDIAMVLMERLRLTNLTPQPRRVVLTLHQRRNSSAGLEVDERTGKKLFRGRGDRGVMFEVDGPCTVLGSPSSIEDERNKRREAATDVFFTLDLPANGSQEIILKLPSPIAEGAQADALEALDYSQARLATLKFWSDYLARGAQFHVPDEAVNTLFRANLWHSLRLPRRHGGEEPNVRIDLPFSNFAYSQTGTPWPVNQAAYVDYMLYSLRGYDAISLEELLAQYRNNQEADGHVGGNAKWGVYTPSMLYAAAQYYLLSGDRAGFERLLAPSLKAMDWCLRQTRKDGLLYAPLNDLTGEGVWAFNQAYMYAGLELFGRALNKYGNSRADEVLREAVRVHDAIERTFEAASIQSTLVQLRDHTWIPYVPSNADQPRRLMDIWYPTDIDTGAVHLIRLNAIDPRGDLADSLLNDEEDNLLYKGWGSANEPVYDQHATAYLLRDDVKPLIRAFYSLMASGFSQSVFEPVEHRWTWGQFFGPPSTDGAWFEVYRNMLVHETGDGSLALGLATPRAWLQDGKHIDVVSAPTYFGPVSFHVSSRSASRHITAIVELEQRTPARTLFIRLRHPENKPLKSVTVNGKAWSNFNRQKEWVEIPNPESKQYTIEAGY